MKEPWGDGVKTLTNTHTPGLDQFGLAGRLCVNGDLIGSEMTYRSHTMCVCVRADVRCVPEFCILNVYLLVSMPFGFHRVITFFHVTLCRQWSHHAGKS